MGESAFSPAWLASSDIRNSEPNPLYLHQTSSDEVKDLIYLVRDEQLSRARAIAVQTWAAAWQEEHYEFRATPSNSRKLGHHYMMNDLAPGTYLARKLIPCPLSHMDCSRVRWSCNLSMILNRLLWAS